MVDRAKFGFSMQSPIIRLYVTLPKEAGVISFPVGLFGIIGKGERMLGLACKRSELRLSLRGLLDFNRHPRCVIADMTALC